MIPTLMADDYENYPVIASISCVFIYILILAMTFINFGILYYRLVPAFIKGVKKGCKFNKIEKFDKEDKEVNVAEIQLPGLGMAGRMQYNEENQNQMTRNITDMTGGMDHTAISINKKDGVMAEEEKKSKFDGHKSRFRIYDDQAI
jgi:hypothetical protein